jgi:transcriptional regulator with XRE-family HTH domain
MTATQDLLPAGVGARSTLYRLMPAGLGTIGVESLTSYIMRLASAHHLLPGVLLGEVLRDSIVGPKTGASRPLGEILRGAHAVNGLTGQASVWVKAIERATDRPGLSSLTMLAWRDVLPIRHVIRDRPSHCPSCFEEFAEAGVVYEPLVWTLRLVTVCLVHLSSLRTTCGACGVTQRALGYRAQPGLCRECSHWLGDAPSGVRPSDAEVLTSRAVADLVLGPRERPRAEDIGPATVAAREQLGLSPEQFAAALGVGAPDVAEWASGPGLPSISAVLRICSVGGWSARAFLEGRLIASGTPRLPGAAPAIVRVAIDWNAVSAGVRRRLTRPGAPPTMRELALPYHVGSRWLSKKLTPELRAEIRERRAAWVTQQTAARLTSATSLIANITADLLAEGRSASRRQVEARLTGSLSLREPALNEAWRQAQPRHGRSSSAGSSKADASAVPVVLDASETSKAHESVGAAAPLTTRIQPR